MIIPVKVLVIIFSLFASSFLGLLIWTLKSQKTQMAKLREENRAKEADEMFNKLREIHIKTQNIDDNVRENRESTIKEFGDLKLHISKNYVDVDTFKTFKDENREDHAEIFKKINGN